jgi:hypothetical protein
MSKNASLEPTNVDSNETPKRKRSQSIDVPLNTIVRSAGKEWRGCIQGSFVSAPRALSAEDFAEITNLLHANLLAIDGNAPSQFADLFSEAGSCEVVKFGLRSQGREELEKLCTDLSTKFANTMHWEVN